MTPDNDPKFNLTGGAKYAGVSVPLMREIIARGEVRALRLSAKTVRIAKSDLDAWLASCVIRPKTEMEKAA
jgi:excisionase family DNA binding protein